MEFTDEEFEELLEVIRNWDVLEKGIKELLEYAKSIWTYKYKVETRGDWYCFITGGLSDNEEIIMAMKSNLLVMALSWHSSTRYGVHIFNTGGFLEKNPFYQYIRKE